MSQCGDYEDINFYVINVFYGIVIAVYFLPFKKKNHPVYMYIDTKYNVCMRFDTGTTHILPF